MNEARRTLCKLAGLTAFGVVAGCGGGGASKGDGGGSDGGVPMCGPQTILVGINLSDLPLDTAVLFSNSTVNVYVCRDDKGIFAFDAECTHLGCNVRPTSFTGTPCTPDMQAPPTGMQVNGLKQGFNCCCHGATYDANAQVTGGPAPRSLDHFLVCTTVSGQLAVDTAQVVDPKTRYHV